MKRTLTICAAMILCAGALVFVLRVSAADETPDQLIAKARSLVSYSLAGPFELRANLEIVQPNGKKQKGTYTLDWAAPDRFREEIHWPGYDEIKIASGTTLYRKQSTADRPLCAYQIEALMNPESALRQFQSDLAFFVKSIQVSGSTNRQVLSPPKVMDIGLGSPWYEKCVNLALEQVCVNPEHEWAFDIALPNLGNNALIEYQDYRRFSGGFYPWSRHFTERGITAIEADVKKMRSMREFSPDTFTPPADAHTISLCSGEIAPRRLPFEPQLPLPWEDFPNPEIFSGVVNINGTLDRAAILESGGPKADADLKQFANQIRFIPATCDGKPVQSEGVFVLEAGDVQGGPGRFTQGRRKWLYHPDLPSLPQPTLFGCRIQPQGARTDCSLGGDHAGRKSACPRSSAETGIWFRPRSNQYYPECISTQTCSRP